jgi:SagB-type dehydrogenase family enzyme
VLNDVAGLKILKRNLAMEYSFSLKASILQNSSEKLVLKLPRSGESIQFDQPTSTLTLLINKLSNSEKVAYLDLLNELQSADNTDETSELIYLLDQLTLAGLLNYTLTDQEKPLITLEPMAPGLQLKAHRLHSVANWQLSRFCYFHLVGQRLLCESSRGCCRVWLHPDVTHSLISLLSKSHSLSELKKKWCDIREETLDTLIVLLDAAGILVDAEDTMESSFWEFHDLLFHTRSRLGRHDYPLGATYRYKNKTPSPPAQKPSMSRDVIFLKTPDIDTFQHDLPFQHVLEKRRSIRQQGTHPITLNQLSEFLYRSLRKKNHQDNIPYDAYPSRNYPSGGALYEIEVYLLINLCDGLERGVYHYCANRHALEKISPDTQAMQSMITQAARATAATENHDVLLTMTARFKRLAWKYESVAYALILKHVGVLIQTFYLVATVMGLAPCGVGNGNSMLFARISGLDFYEESAVGEFILNSAD